MFLDILAGGMTAGGGAPTWKLQFSATSRSTSASKARREAATGLRRPAVKSAPILSRMWPSVWLTGLGLLTAAAPVSQAFVPSTAARAAATGHQPQQQLQQQMKKQQRSGVGMAATRRDVLRMPSSEPMVREQRDTP